MTNPAPDGSMGSATGSESMGEAATPAKEGGSKFKGLVLKALGSLVVIGVVAGVGLYLNRNDVSTAKVGDCMPATIENEEAGINKVDCASAEAKYKVLGVVESKTMAEFDATDVETLCAAAPTSDTAYWIGPVGQKGTVFCLQVLGAAAS